MKYTVYALRKENRGWTDVSTSDAPYTQARLTELRGHLLMRSQDFDETLRFRVEESKP